MTLRFRPLVHFFVPVFFRAPFGGVHANVAFQSRSLKSEGHEVTVMCPPGPFAEGLREEGIDVLEDTMEDVESAVERALSASPFDIIHAHPFRSREIGLEVSRQTGAPFLLTIHGMYEDGLRAYADEVNNVFTVSDAIREHVLAQDYISPSKVVTIMNGVDTTVFTPDGDAAVREESDPEFRIFLPTRLDQDKRFILDVVLDTWSRQAETLTDTWKWVIAGTGTAESEVREAAAKLSDALGFSAVEFLGWQSAEQLAAQYRLADVCVAPGRCCLEGLASGTPSFALGSQSYDGLVTPETWRDCSRGNFGGFGKKMDAYSPGRLFRELESLLYDGAELKRLSGFGSELARKFFDQKIIDTRLLSFYATTKFSKRTSRSTFVHREFSYFGETIGGDEILDRNGPCFSSANSGATFEQNEGDLSAEVSTGDKPVYLLTGRGFLAQAPKEEELRTAEASSYSLEVELKHSDPGCDVSAWGIGYQSGEKIGARNQTLSVGLNRFDFSLPEDTDRIRLALRFFGTGRAQLGPLVLKTYPRQPMPFESIDANASQEQKYQGENLIFVFGAPRSGTTWVLKLLEEHPDIVAADVDSLGVRVNDSKTLETNVFNPSRPFSDIGIWRKFALMSAKNPGRTLVEKTPLHLLYASRIRRIFPRAQTLLVLRDGRAAVASTLAVGRTPGAWWSGAPSDIKKAASLWKPYGLAALQERERSVTLRYEDLLAEPAPVLREVMAQLGLDTGSVQKQIDASAGGKNIAIPGVFRQGSRDGWRKQLSIAEQEYFERVLGGLNAELGYEDTGLAVDLYGKGRDAKKSLDSFISKNRRKLFKK